MKSSTFYFHLKTKIFADFQIGISVPFKNKIITAADFTKKSGQNISKVLNQEESATIKVFGKIINLFLGKAKDYQ